MLYLCYITVMKWVLMCIVLWALTGFQAVSLAQNNTADNPAIPMEKQLGDIIKRLNSEDWAERETASEDLRKLRQSYGTPLIKILQMQINAVPPEVKARITAELAFAEEIAKTKELLSVFDNLIPQVKLSNFIVYNTGACSWNNGVFTGFDYVYGWVLLEDTEYITIFTPDLQTEKCFRGQDLPPDWETLRKTHPEGMPLPGQFTAVEFPAGLIEFLLRKVQKPGLQENDFLIYASRPFFMKQAVYAYWALRINEESMALNFLELANETWLDAETDNRGFSIIEISGTEEPPSFDKSLKTQTAEIMRAQAISSANSGMPREELVKKWELIKKLIGSDESVEMICLYKQLIAEDKAWVEPDKRTLETMSPENSVSYWLYKLRDCNMRPTQAYWFLSTRIDFSLPPAIQDFPETGSKDPFDELFKLSWHAIPFLIDHLYDARPTRVKTEQRLALQQVNIIYVFSELLLSYGDCCHLILENIITRSLSKDYIIETLCAIVEKNTTIEIKRYAVQTLGRFRYQRAAEILITFLDDDTTITNFATPLRTRDEAFYALALIFKHIPELREITASVNTTLTAKDADLDSLKSWWAQNKDRLDWDNIRRQAEYEETLIDGYVLPPLNHLTR